MSNLSLWIKDHDCNLSLKKENNGALPNAQTIRELGKRKCNNEAMSKRIGQDKDWRQDKDGTLASLLEPPGMHGTKIKLCTLILTSLAHWPKHIAGHLDSGQWTLKVESLLVPTQKFYVFFIPIVWMFSQCQNLSSSNHPNS